MTNSIPLDRRVRVLLNTLAVERYMRRPLLNELVDELTLADAHPDVVQAGRALLERLKVGVDEAEYQRRIGSMLELTARRHQRAS